MNGTNAPHAPSRTRRTPLAAPRVLGTRHTARERPLPIRPPLTVTILDHLALSMFTCRRRPPAHLVGSQTVTAANSGLFGEPVALRPRDAGAATPVSRSTARWLLTVPSEMSRAWASWVLV